MPKVVDAELRREAIADATLAVITRDGVSHASLRNVADEAGLAIGSVRHYFASQGEVVSFAMRHLVDRIVTRVLEAARPVAGSDSTELDAHQRLAASEAILSQLLPLDPERHAESTAWLNLAAESVIRPDLRPTVAEFHDGTRKIVRRIVASAQRHGSVPPGKASLEVETERLAALLDGLAANAVLHPERLRPKTMRAVLRRHLTTLA